MGQLVYILGICAPSNNFVRSIGPYLGVYGTSKLPKPPKLLKNTSVLHHFYCCIWGRLEMSAEIRVKSNRSVIVPNNKFSECITENKLTLFIFF